MNENNELNEKDFQRLFWENDECKYDDSPWKAWVLIRKDFLRDYSSNYHSSNYIGVGFKFIIDILSQYEQKVLSSANYPDMGSLQGASFLAHGLAGEAGNVNDTIKNLYYDQCEGKPVRTDENQEKVVRVLGKTLWYLVMLASEVGSSLSQVMKNNMEDIGGK